MRFENLRGWCGRMLWLTLGAFALAPWLGSAGPVSLHRFVDGTVANAGDVNDNFSALSAAIAARARWTPVDQVSLGSFPNSSASATYTLPAQVPASASEVLLYARAHSGNVSVNTPREFAFHTVDDLDTSRKYTHFLYVYGYPQSAVGYTSDNFWLPIPSDRKVYVTRVLNGSFNDNFGGHVFVVGYR